MQRRCAEARLNARDLARRVRRFPSLREESSGGRAGRRAALEIQDVLRALGCRRTGQGIPCLIGQVEHQGANGLLSPALSSRGGEGEASTR